MLETHADQMTVRHGTHILTDAEEEVKYEVPSHWKGKYVLCLLWKKNRSVNQLVFCKLSAMHAACCASWDSFKPCLSFNHHYCLHDTSSYFLSPGVTWIFINGGKLPNMSKIIFSIFSSLTPSTWAAFHFEQIVHNNLSNFLPLTVYFQKTHLKNSGMHFQIFSLINYF